VADDRLAGRRIVLTGASGGIGAAARQRLLAAGARVVGIDVAPGEGVLEADVTGPAEIRAAMATAARQMGGIDTLINNAGIGVPQDAGDFPNREARRVMEVNFFGAWNATAAAMTHLVEARGHVVNVASGLALVDFPWSTAYSASKRALEGYSNILRVEYDGRITVTTVYPGYVRTAIHDRSTDLGASLEGLVRADTLEQAAGALVTACARKPQRIASSGRSEVEFWLARRFPAVAAMLIRSRLRAAMAGRPRPSFVRFAENGEADVS
jgi:NAD(P)-dependent dehydrogenase (short-subunit alcohol dehydrogenase family)